MLSLVFSGCEHVVLNESRINMQGSTIEATEDIQLNGLRLDTLLFANGKEHFVVSGSFNQGKTSYKYALHYDRHPKDKDTRLVYLMPPYEELNDATCRMEMKDNGCEITWTKNYSRMFLKDTFNEER